MKTVPLPLLLGGPPALALSSWFWFLPQTLLEHLVGHEKIAEEMDEDKPWRHRLEKEMKPESDPTGQV